jgi:hypothetical protein
LNLNDDSGAATTVDVTFGTGWLGSYADGAPNNLQGDRVFTSGGVTGDITISGLTPGGTYNIALIAGFNGAGSFSSDFTIGGTTLTAADTVGAGANANGPLTFTAGVTHVLFSNIVADGSGNITFTMINTPGASNGVLAGLQVETVPPTPAVTLDGSETGGSIASTAPVSTQVGVLSMVNTNPTGFAYSLHPSGNTTHFDIPAGTSNLLTDATLSAGTSYNIVVLATNATDGFSVTNGLTIDVPNFVVATGGNTTTDSGGYRIHTFTSGGTLTVTTGGDVEYLTVGGGGAGGSGFGAGGGAGGMLTGTTTVAVSGYTVVVGSGGAVASANGTDSSFAGVTGTGGGGGANLTVSGNAGGSGGGGGGQNPTTGGSGTAGQGFSGGNGVNSGAGGGGGASEAGVNGTGGNVSGRGGDGLASVISGTSTFYAQGGAGYFASNNPNKGGGGDSLSNGQPDENADPNTGSGGGADPGSGFGTGGSGIVIVRYALPPTPEMDVKGNSQSIADGDATPDTADHTDFGATLVSAGTIVRTFTIDNTDNGTLSLTGTPVVVVSGTHAIDFTVTLAPATSIAGMGSTTFQVTFDPSAGGTRTATLSIANDDADEDPYDFAIEGEGTLAVPEINVTGNGQNITDGDSTPATADDTDFGDMLVSAGTVVRTFTIENTGAAALSLTGTPLVVVSGTHASDFTVTAAPASSVAGSGSTTFDVTFDPSDAGLREATLSIANDDADEDPYDFAIVGTGVYFLPATGGNSTNDIGGYRIHTFLNDGTFAVPSGGNVEVLVVAGGGGGGDTYYGGGGGAGGFLSNNALSVIASNYTVTVGAGGAGANGSGTGSSGANSIFDTLTAVGGGGAGGGGLGGTANSGVAGGSGGGENHYSVQATGGTGTVGQGNDGGGSPGNNAGGGGGAGAAGSDGGAGQNGGPGGVGLLSSISGSSLFYAGGGGAGANGFPTPGIPGAGGNGGGGTGGVAATAPMSGTPNTGGGGGGAGGYDHTITTTTHGPGAAGGSGIVIVRYAFPPVPEVNVTGNGQSIADGDSSPDTADHTDFETALVPGGTVVRTFTIENIGGAALSLTGATVVVVSGTHASDFTVTLAPATSIVPSSSTTFQVTFDPSATGTRTATLSIANDDADEDPYDFAIEGEGTLPVPEINVTGNALSIADGDGSPDTLDHTDFGATQEDGGTVVRTFTIENSGGGALSLTGTPLVDVSGTHSNDFTVTLDPASSVAGSGSTTFQVTFDPSALGLRSATLSIANDDADEDPYDFAIEGTGFDFVAATGGNSTNDVGGYRIHTFTSGGDLTVTAAGQIEYLIVGGGAGGGKSHGAGGGGGGMVTGSTLVVVSGYTAVVGSGGAGSTVVGPGANGSISSFAGNTATGGGGGGGGTGVGSAGANGGGGSNTQPGGAGSQGFNGGDATGNNAGGGGGAGELGQNGVASLQSGRGGDGLASAISGTSTYYAQGGCGFYSNPINTLNRGGGGNSISGQVAENGDPNTGGGGGAATGTGPGAGDGGSGIVIVRYLLEIPEMNVTGNGQNIADGDSSPDAADHTDFEATFVAGGTVVRTFTIENNWVGALSLTGTPVVVVSGAHSNDFTVTVAPAGTIATNASTIFQVTFDPSATGARTATLSIANDDADEDPYDFAIEGEGTAAALPEMNVTGNAQSIADGDSTPTVDDHTYFSVAAVSGDTVVRTFTIENTGSASLSLTGTPLVVVSGTHAADFSVTLDPANSVATSGSTTFEVTFDPSAAGTRTAALSIANDDADEDPYDFAVQGFGDAGVLTSYDEFPTDPNLAGAWTDYVYYQNPGRFPENLTDYATWGGSDLAFASPDSGATPNVNWAAGVYRTGTSRLPTDTVTLTVKSLGKTSGSWGYVGAMISVVSSPGYITTTDDTYSLLLIPESATHFHHEVRRTYLDGTGDFILYSGASTAFAGPYTNEISRVGDHYEFRANGALLYTTATPAAGDFYDLTVKDSMAYYQIVFGGDGAVTATVDDFGVPPSTDPAVTVDGSTTVDSIAGNAPAGTLVGTLSMLNTNPVGFAYSLDAGGDTTYFEIPGGTSNLVTKAALGAGPYVLKIVGAKGGFSVTNDITITINADISVALSNTNTFSNVNVGTQVGLLSMVNAALPGEFALSLHPSGNTTHFDVPVGTSNLLTTATLSAGTYDIVVLATNATDGFWVTNGYTIAVAAVDPLPLPVQYWRLNEGSGTLAFNSVSAGNTGTLVNSPTWISAGLEPKLTARDLYSGASVAALDLQTGDTDYMNGGDINLTSTSGGGEVTVSMWLNPDSVSGDYRLLSQLSGGLTAGAVGIDTGQGAGSLWVNDGVLKTLVPAGGLTTGTWQHLALVWDGDQVTAYLDGIEQLTATSQFLFAGVDFGIGAPLLLSFGNAFDGQIDDVAIFASALDVGQITSLVNGSPAMRVMETIFMFR